MLFPNRLPGVTTDHILAVTCANTVRPVLVGSAKHVGLARSSFPATGAQSSVTLKEQNTPPPQSAELVWDHPWGAELSCNCFFGLSSVEFCGILWYTTTAFCNTDKARSCASQNLPLTPEKGYWENVCGREKSPQSYLSTQPLFRYTQDHILP